MNKFEEATGKEICQLKEKVDILEKVVIRLHIRLALLEKKYKKEEKDNGQRD